MFSYNSCCLDALLIAVHADHDTSYVSHKLNDQMFVHNKFTPFKSEINNPPYPRIFCWISTHPPNHGTKAAAVRDTWGKRCDKILFISNEDGKQYRDVGLI